MFLLNFLTQSIHARTLRLKSGRGLLIFARFQAIRTAASQHLHIINSPRKIVVRADAPDVV